MRAPPIWRSLWPATARITAIGIVMAREQLTTQAAFARLRQVSNELNRRVVDLADQVVLTGALPTSPPG